MKAILAVLAIVVLAVVIYLGVSYRRVQQAAYGPAKEIVSESITKSGDTWHVSFVTKFDAPLDKVFEAYSHPERLKEYAPDNVLKSEVLEDQGNTKTIDVVGKLDILPPGFKVQNIRIRYTMYPAEHRITTETIDFKLADMKSELKFTAAPDNKGTILDFSETSKDKAPMLVESLQKGALREQYLTTVRAVNKALGLTPAHETREAG
ncbi:MAG TPA: SRPBCC family protein [Candidatus Binatia bacterium]|nr:SRPBCC family protein [Candidatus Binatia bacterium]